MPSLGSLLHHSGITTPTSKINNNQVVQSFSSTQRTSCSMEESKLIHAGRDSEVQSSTVSRDPENPSVDRQEHNTKKQRRPKIQIISKSLQALTALYRKFHKKPYDQIEYSEKEVYQRLMEDLENVKEKYPMKWKIMVTLEIFVLLSHLVGLVASLTVPMIKSKTLLQLRICQWIILSSSLFSGLSFVRLVTYLGSLPVLWWWNIDRYMVFFINQIKQCVDVTLWFGSVLFVWFVWFRPPLKHSHGDLSVVVVRQITRLLIALELGAFLWFLKNILYLKLEADLHYSQLVERIRLTIVYFHGLEMIESRGVWKFLIKNKEDHKMINRRRNEEQAPATSGGNGKTVRLRKNLEADKKVNKNIWKEVYGIERETVPIWILRRLSEEYLFHVQEKKALQGIQLDAMLDDEELKEKAEKMLKMIIVDQERGTRSDIKHEDLEKYGLSPDEEKFLFRLFVEKPRHKGEAVVDKAKHLDDFIISRNDFLNWAVRAFKNCAGLESTLRSSKNVFVKLNRLLSAFVIIVVLLIWLLLSSVVDTGQLALLFSPFVAATFVFGESCRKMFEGIIFAFAMHPFDVGDRVIIDEKQMKVNELHILTSVFYKYDTQELVIYPNSELACKKIINLDITPDQGDRLEFAAPKAPLEDIQDLQLCIILYLDNNIMYTSDSKVVKTAIGDVDIKMAVHFKYLVSYLSAETKAVRKSEILTQIMQFLHEMKRQNKRNLCGTDPFIVEFTVPTKGTSLEKIRDIKQQIMRYVAIKHPLYKDCSKVVLTDVVHEKEIIKMALHIRKKKKKKKTTMKSVNKRKTQHDHDNYGDEDDEDCDEEFHKEQIENIEEDCDEEFHKEQIENIEEDCDEEFHKEKIENIEEIKTAMEQVVEQIVGLRSPSMWSWAKDSIQRDNLNSSTFGSRGQDQSSRNSDEITQDN